MAKRQGKRVVPDMDIPEMTEAHFAAARPMKDVMPDVVEAMKRGPRSVFRYGWIPMWSRVTRRPVMAGSLVSTTCSHVRCRRLSRSGGGRRSPRGPNSFRYRIAGVSLSPRVRPVERRRRP
jgi:hypothetical protein